MRASPAARYDQRGSLRQQSYTIEAAHRQPLAEFQICTRAGELGARLRGQLGESDLPVDGAGLDQFLVGADAHDPALVEHEDAVGVRTVPMRWATISTVASDVSSRSALRSASSVLKSSAEKLSSKTKTSGCTARARAIDRRWRWPPETLSALGHGHRVLLLAGLDELGGLRDAHGLGDLLVRRIVVAVRHVRGDVAGEQQRAAGRTRCASAGPSCGPRNVPAVDEDLSLGRVVEAHQQVGQGRPSPRGAIVRVAVELSRPSSTWSLYQSPSTRPRF